MRCSYFSTCMIWEKYRDEKMCAKLFCRDKCPPPREIDGKSGMAKGALPREKE